MLIDPTPQLMTGKIAWRQFLDVVKTLPLKALRDRSSTICDLEIEDFEPLKRALTRELEIANEEGDLAEVLLLVALKLGTLEAFAYHPAAGNCFAVRRFFWSTFAQRPVALRSIETSTAVLPIDDLAPQSIDRDMANRALFVRADALNVLLGIRPPSASTLAKVATKMVADQVAAGHRMKKTVFTIELRRLLPGCSKERAMSAWSAHAPAAWRRPGRPPTA